jgi:hypothetical protein
MSLIYGLTLSCRKFQNDGQFLRKQNKLLKYLSKSELGEAVKKIIAFAAIALLLSGCSQVPAPVTILPKNPDVTQTESPGTTPDLNEQVPSEWTSTEKEIFTAYSNVYPENKVISLVGKRALMDNAHLICQAYSEGYSRQEIQAATSGGGVSTAMSDDWMTLSVTYLCPEYLDQQTAY